MWTAEEIRSAVERTGVSLDDAQANALKRHLELVLRERSAINLVSESTVDDALRLHTVDSLLALDVLSGRSSLVDIGAGAGFPGVPLAIALRVPTVLIESRSKRAAFLSEVARELREDGFDIEVENARAEDPGLVSRSGGADAAVARAVSGLPTLVELAAPFIGINGLFVAYKGRPSPEELTRGNEAAGIVGMGEAEVLELKLPGGAEARSLVSFVKERESKVALPRRAGKASKSPLA
jgi:16S rRNA (guanine527-N7)-methyltransferase